MNIRVDINTPLQDGTEVVFRSPVDCSQVTGLIVYYDFNTASKEFAFADAHGNNVGDIDHLFAENVVVKVILDVTHAMAYVQNADTNAYIERTFVKTVNGTPPDENGNVEVSGSGSGKDGITPHIGENGNWWIGDTDTGVLASGGDSKVVVVTYNERTGKLSKTGTAIIADLDSGKIVFVYDNGTVSPVVLVNKASGERELYTNKTVLGGILNSKLPMSLMMPISSDGYVTGYSQGITMPVPSASLVGAVPTVTETGISWRVPEGGSGGGSGGSNVYVGKEEPTDENVQIWINPEGGADNVLTDAQVNALIDEKLGVIENGTY